jgi:hypothetical protein
MPFDLTNFSTNLQQYGYTSANKFDVSFTLPNLMTTTLNSQQNGATYGQDLPQLLQMRANRVATPSVSALTIGTPIYGMGPVKKQPYNAVFGDIPMSFLCDQYGLIWNFFYEWYNLMYNFTEITANAQTQTLQGVATQFQAQQSPNYTTSYNDDIVSPVVNIFKYDNSGNTIQTWNLYDVKPMIITATDLGWDNTNKLYELVIQFNYREWSMFLPNQTVTSTTS